jgi:hypothetical protein
MAPHKWLCDSREAHRSAGGRTSKRAERHLRVPSGEELFGFSIMENRKETQMMENGKTVLVAVLVLGLIAFGVMPALAQDKPTDNMQLLREKVRADKKLLVAANMELTESEAKAFWPVYENYQNELFLLRARTAKLVRDYAAAFKDINNETARKLLDESLIIESLGLKLRKDYLPKFRKVLPDKKVARYYQIENKIQAALYYELAVEIPLVQ